MLRIVAILTLMGGLCQTALGQTPTPENSEVISVRVSAEVKSSMELITIRNMTFKDVRPSQQQVYISPVINGNAGQMKATGTPNARVRVTFFPNSKIYHSASNRSIDFNYLVAVSSEDNQATSELIDSDSRIFEMNNNGELFLWVGGRADISNIQPGNYTGDFVLEVEYL